MTSSGAERLETLDGAEMPNFINGSRLKKYELPLTEDILRKLHMSKTYKEGQAQLKIKAQREARERWEKIKKRRANIMAISSKDQDESNGPNVLPFSICLQLLAATNVILEEAIVDLGADCGCGL